jgi:AraC-like DNA-binding protein
MDGRIFGIKEQLGQHFSREWNIDQMASTFGISAAHFQRLFKQHTGITPMRYLHSLRLEKAKELIENSYGPIGQIALRVGFADESRFSRDFKARYGVTPTECRREHWRMIQSATDKRA